MKTYSYFTDGSATMTHENNKYIRGAGGWAFIKFIDGKRDNAMTGGCVQTTNNEMELYAIYASMKDFLENCKNNDTLEIYSDSGYSIDIYTKWASNWEKNNWKRAKKPIKNLELIKATWSLKKESEKRNCTIKFIKVKGHSNNVLNNEADELAVNAKKNVLKTKKTTGYGNKNDPLLGGKSKFKD